MTKILLEFDSIEDREDWKIHAQANKMHTALYDLEQALRKVCKYENPTQRDVFWREEFYRILKENDVEIV